MFEILPTGRTATLLRTDHLLTVTQELHMSLDQSAIDAECVKSTVFTQDEYLQRYSIQSACAFAKAAAEAGLAWAQMHGRSPT